MRLATEALRRAEEEEARLAEEALSLLSEEQKKIEEAKAKYIRELEEKRVAQLAEKAAAEASLEEALKMDSQAQVDEESVSEPVKDIQLESKPESGGREASTENRDEGTKARYQGRIKGALQQETRPAPDPEMDAKKLRRFRELQKKVEEAHRLLRNPPPDPITSDIKRRQQAARDTIEKAHLTPCFFDSHGGCKDPNCYFLHDKKKTPAAKSNPNKPVSKMYPKATPIPKITTEVTNQRGVLYEWHEKGKKGAFGYIRLDSGEELYCKKESFIKEPSEFRESMPVKVEAILRCDSRKEGQRDEAKNVRFLDDKSSKR